MFSLCRLCTEINQQTICHHNNEERAFTGTWVTDELKMAVDKGYIVDTIYEIWHFDHVEQYDPRSKTGGIFTEYIIEYTCSIRYTILNEEGIIDKGSNTAQARCTRYTM
jgi:hypothetical protein